MQQQQQQQIRGEEPRLTGFNVQKKINFPI